MKTDNVIQVKSFAFAVRTVRFCQLLAIDRREYVLSRQLLRCGTSIGANVEEAIGGQSRPDFLSKLSIAYKEARETLYWLRLMKETDLLTEPDFQSLYADGDELCRILTAIKKTTKGS